VTSFQTRQASFQTRQASFQTRQASFQTRQASFQAGQASFQAGQTSFRAGQTSFRAGQTSFRARQTSFQARRTSFRARRASWRAKWFYFRWRLFLKAFNKPAEPHRELLRKPSARRFFLTAAQRPRRIFWWGATAPIFAEALWSPKGDMGGIEGSNARVGQNHGRQNHLWGQIRLENIVVVY
jgi:DNA-directed RNA polymerase II subunit RPB1